MGVKSNIKHFFRGLYEANLEMQKNMRGYDNYRKF